MKLLKKPLATVETIELSVPFGSGPQQFASKPSVSDVTIVCPDVDKNDKDNVWQKLKYGTIPDLADVMHEGKKIDKIEFPNDNVILYGVIPFTMQRTATWEGRVFECHIDYYEVIN